MLKRPNTGRGLFYTRDSGGEHETTPSEYLRWAQRQATELGVVFSGTPEQIDEMIHEGRFQDGDVFLDFCVKGNKLQRPALDSLFSLALTDPNITHVFIPRRDRFARPDNPLDAIRMEDSLREAGLTIVFMDKTLAPVSRSRRDLGETIVAMIDYDQAGKERRTLAEKILYAQLNLAKQGYSTGGRPPFGFQRWLVQADGTLVRQLADGESVKRAGHHVVWMPGSEEKLALIRRILQMLETTPATRVAAILTAEGIPSPDAGRLRKDGGVTHLTSGVWRQQAIVNIARNPLLQAVMQYGQRSMGDRLRFSPDGPREIAETDRGVDDKVKVVVNLESARIKATAHFDSLVDEDRHRQLLEKLDQRSGTQRGKPRSRDPHRNPLSGRVFDMGCGWPMYRQPSKDSFRYTCALYQQSNGKKCRHNHVDGVVATRFLLGCIRQRLFAPTLRQKLEKKLRDIAQRNSMNDSQDTELAAKKATLADVRHKREKAGINLALAEGPDQRGAIAAAFDNFVRQEKILEAEIHQLERTNTKFGDVDAEVAAALAKIEHLASVVSAEQELSRIGQLFQQINARMFLRFTESRLNKRTINKLSSGIVSFGATSPPVALYEGPTAREYVKDPATPDGIAGFHSHESPGVPGSGPGREDGSLGNVCRGQP
jgi:hypothetical protein